MNSLFQKSTQSKYLTKFDKNRNLLRSAEQFDSGNWVVHVYKGIDISGEYTDTEFKEIKKYFI